MNLYSKIKTAVDAIGVSLHRFEPHHAWGVWVKDKDCAGRFYRERTCVICGMKDRVYE